jgi:hypothetical protein
VRVRAVTSTTSAIAISGLALIVLVSCGGATPGVAKAAASVGQASTPQTAIPFTANPACSALDRVQGWVSRENAHKGNPKWREKVVRGFAGDGQVQRSIAASPRLIKKYPPVSGWFDQASVTCGQSVGLHLSGRGKRIVVELYRTGYYRGAGARLIWSTTTAPIPYRSQVNVTPDPTHTVSTSWPTSVSISITSGFPPGQYVARINDGWKATLVPLTIRDDQSTAPILAISSVLTWQAYNHWGGSSLYRGIGGNALTRSRVVSFDRPYDGSGADNYLIHEYPLIRLAESKGLDLAYATDLDLNSNPEQVRKHLSITFGGHGEYWTTSMRNAVDLARAIGINIANFGANAAYWRTRLENNGRNVAVWRDTNDPYLNDVAMRTNRWRDGVIPRPESLLFGVQYAGLGVKADYKVVDANIWPFIGTGLATGQLIDGIVGKEVDSPDAGPGPALQFLMSALAKIGKKTVRVGFTYYTTAKNSGVLDASTDGWVCAIDNVCGWGMMPSKTSSAAAAITTQILKALAAGPLGISHPAKINIPAH